MTLLELMPIPPKMRRLRARLKPECNQRISEKAKLWTSTEYGKLHMARMTELGRTPEAAPSNRKHEFESPKLTVVVKPLLLAWTQLGDAAISANCLTIRRQ
jgi:hypothetical protein